MASKSEKKVDKRSKEYRDSLKKKPSNVARGLLYRNQFTEKSNLSLIEQLVIPVQEPETIYQQLQWLKQENKNLWATVNVLQEQVKNIETKLG